MKQTEVTYATPEYPRQLRLDTTTYCPASCLSCHRHLTDRKGRMTLEFLEKILQDVARWGNHLQEVVPVNYGEFFGIKEWYLILNRLAHYLPKTQIVIPTNGYFLDQQKIDQLCRIPTVKIINFSVNAYYDETYEAFTKLPASNIGNIIKSIAQIKTQRPDIQVWASMVSDPSYQTDRERDEWLKFWGVLANKAWVLSASSACRDGKKVIIPNKLPCRSIFSDIVIGFDGKLSSCCWDAGFTLDLGSYQGDLKKDWKNAKLENLRQTHNEHQRDEYEICAECTSA